MRDKDIKQAVSIGLSRTPLSELEKACRRENRSRSNYVEMVLRRHFGSLNESHHNVE